MSFHKADSKGEEKKEEYSEEFFKNLKKDLQIVTDESFKLANQKIIFNKSLIGSDKNVIDKNEELKNWLEVTKQLNEGVISL